VKYYEALKQKEGEEALTLTEVKANKAMKIASETKKTMIKFIF
jgi:hypothetical protein